MNILLQYYMVSITQETKLVFEWKNTSQRINVSFTANIRVIDFSLKKIFTDYVICFIYALFLWSKFDQVV